VRAICCRVPCTTRIAGMRSDVRFHTFDGDMTSCGRSKCLRWARSQVRVCPSTSWVDSSKGALIRLYRNARVPAQHRPDTSTVLDSCAVLD
jgi:hypothetical protein